MGGRWRPGERAQTRGTARPLRPACRRRGGGRCGAREGGPGGGCGEGGRFGGVRAGTTSLTVTDRTGAFLRRKYIDEPDAPFPGGPKFRDAVGWCVCFGETFTLSIFMGKKAYEAARGIQQVAADA